MRATFAWSLVMWGIWGCGSSDLAQEPSASEGGDTGAAASDTGAAASPFDRIYNVTSLSYDGDFVVIRTTDVPDHKSPFFGKGNAKYEAYDGTNSSFSTAINLMGTISDVTLKEQDITFRIPRHPKAAATHQATSLGAIGIGLNGVVIFNQYNGMGALLGSLEFNNIDQWNGHPTPAPGQTYHYHTEPLWLTKKLGSDALVGFLLDGFPVYGPVEGGKRLQSSDLDDYHGHTHATADYPEGIYHYHCTDDAPWINGDGYYGSPGTVTR
ncbi:MAG: YHYH protein [Polyangiales bacterium]